MSTKHLARKFKYVPSVIIGILLFLLLTPRIVTAVTAESSVNYSDLVISSDEGSNGYRQIFYSTEEDKTYITNTNYTNSNPVHEKNLIAWMGQLDGKWQIFLYNLETETTIQLTSQGNNVNPKISNGNVVWEGQVEGTWQIFYFDGIKVVQITNGKNPSLDVDIENTNVVYARKELDDTGWKIFTYNTKTKEKINLTEDSYGRKPKIQFGEITWVNNKNKTERFNDAAYEVYLISIGKEPTPALKELQEEETKIERVVVDEIYEELGVDDNDRTKDNTTGDEEVDNEESPIEDTLTYSDEEITPLENLIEDDEIREIVQDYLNEIEEDNQSTESTESLIK